MVPLQNSTIERPERVFEIDMVVFGTLHTMATLRRITVLAETPRGARRICKSCYGRCEIRRTRVLKGQSAASKSELFIA
jgi:hypothetical protein